MLAIQKPPSRETEMRIGRHSEEQNGDGVLDFLLILQEFPQVARRDDNVSRTLWT